MTDNPQAIDRRLSIAVVERTTSSWEDLREQARQTREAVGNMDSVSAFAYCVGNFLSLTETATTNSPDIQRAVDDFKGVVTYLAERIANDELMMVSIPGKETKKMAISGSDSHSVAIKERFQTHLRELSWLKADDKVVEEGLKVSLLYVLAASFGADPGSAESVRPLAEISNRIMKRDFDTTNPPIPFSKSTHSTSELQVETAVPGVNIVLDQNTQLYLCLEPIAVEGVVGGANGHLAKIDFGDIKGQNLRDQKKVVVVNFLSGEHGDDK